MHDEKNKKMRTKGNTGFVLTYEHRKTAMNLLRIISKKKHIPIRDIISPSHKRELVKCRSVFRICFKEVVPEVTLKATGEILGGRDHTTMVHSKAVHNDLTDPINEHSEESIEYKAFIDDVRRIYYRDHTVIVGEPDNGE